MPRVFWIAIVLVTWWAPLGRATESEMPPDVANSRYAIRAGAFLTALDTHARFGLDGSGLYLDLEDMFGLSSSLWSFEAAGAVRLGESRRSRLSLTYQGFFRKATFGIPEDIEIGGEEILKNTIVDSEFNLQVIKLVYSWSFVMDDRIDMGIGGGFYVMPIDLSIAIDDQTLQQADFYAPLPVLDLHIDYAISSRWFLRQRYSLFYLAAGTYKGDIFDVSVNAEYRLFKRTGIGMGFNSFKLAVEDSGIEDGVIDFDGRITTAYTGLELYVTFDL